MKVIMRADANAQVGSGHLMRCLALAQGLRAAGDEAIFLTTTEGGLLTRLQDEGFPICLLDNGIELLEDARQTRRMVEVCGCDWVVTDGYNFTEEYQRLVVDYPSRMREPSQRHTRLLCIDDMAITHFVADIVLNQNIAVSRDIYSCESYTQLLLGSQYALIREEFLQARHEFVRRVPHKAKNILVTFGGWDHKNLTLSVLQAIEALNEPEILIKVAVGTLNPHVGALRSFVAEARSNFEILMGVGNDMPELMKWADLVITTVGTTLWELCLFKVPTMIGLHSDNIVADTRKTDIAVALADMGAVTNLGQLAELGIHELAVSIGECIHDSRLREAMSGNTAQLVDGRGAARVVSIMESKK